MNSLIKLLRNSIWFYIFLLLAFFPPDYLLQNPLLEDLFDAMKLMGFLLVSMLYLVDIRKHMQRPFNILLLLLWVELFVSTLLSDDASLYSYFSSAVQVLGSCFMVEEIALHSPTKGLKSMYLYFSVIVLINTLTVFLYPDAMYANNRNIWVCWFLGEDNGAYIYYIIASTFAMIYCEYISKRITILAAVTWLSAFIFVFHNDIATGIACQIIWVFLVIIYHTKWRNNLLKAQYALYIMLVGFFFVVVTRDLIIAPIVEALGRSITLSGRTVIWDRTIKLILKRFEFGYGICPGDTYAEMINWRGITMAHDWLLNLGFAGGVVAIILFIPQVYFACKEADAYRKTPFYSCVVIGFIIVYIRAITEGSFWTSYFLFPTLINYSKEFLRLESSQEKHHKIRVRIRMTDPYVLRKIE